MTRGGLFGVVALALLLGAGGLWGATRLDWASTRVAVTGHGAVGDVPLAVTGAQVAPVLVGLAVVAVAGVAAAVALAGVARRILGVLVAAAGLGGLVVALVSWLDPPSAAELPGLVGSAAGGAAAVPGATVSTTAAPLLALVGGLLVAVGGVVLAVADRRLPRMGAKYDAPGAGRPRDPERTAWDELDSGVDPTTEGAFSRPERAD
ncbi:Trp biosynthesis-associated membrane protein [Pseudonocardia xishanensis]|uniref:Membrane protein (TIGR02234 family) n=1 Tax=Pseudonocardia xishanensis TaxID=630995 RepID=A0ABP8RS10_9PSEU